MSGPAPGRNSSDWLTPGQVGHLAGFSDSQIRAEIKAGELHAVQRWSRTGKLCRYWISRDEATAYLRRLDARGPQKQIAQIA